MPPLSIVLLQAVTVYCNNSITCQNLGLEFACLFDGTNHCVSTMIIALGFGWGGEVKWCKAKKSGGMVSPQHDASHHYCHILCDSAIAGGIRGDTVTLILTLLDASHHVAGSGMVERSVRDSRLPSHRQLHRTSSQGCWQQPPLVIRRPQPSARPPRRWNWTTRASEASRRLLKHSDIRRTQYAYFYGTRSFGLCVTMKL